MSGALRIAIVGAESTGKSTLANALGAALAQRTGARVAVVDEWLRQWCEAAGRTPRPDEQATILREQQQRIEAAAERHEIVIADASGLMVAVYSRLLFGDASLETEAVAWHRRVGVTLLTALDLPWVPDGYIRDGPHMREPVDAALRELLARHGLPFHVIGGQGAARLAQALAALRPRLSRAEPSRAEQTTAAGTRRVVWRARALASPPLHRLAAKRQVAPGRELRAHVDGVEAVVPNSESSPIGRDAGAASRSGKR